jgi:SAM-dependent methyltransferase
VLEIGVGQGTHAQLIASRCRSFTGIDLTRHAVEMTSRRFEFKILQMDAEMMELSDSSFDFIWSWGVIHHSADTRRVLKEMHRVLRPAGKCIVMIYHRSRWHYWIVSGLFNGLLRGSLRRKGSLHHVNQAFTDGAIARFYTPTEWHEVTNGLFKIKDIQICGLKTEIIPLPNGRFKSILEAIVPNAAARFFTNRLQMGSFLVAHMEKLEFVSHLGIVPHKLGHVAFHVTDVRTVRERLADPSTSSRATLRSGVRERVPRDRPGIGRIRRGGGRPGRVDACVG